MPVVAWFGIMSLPEIFLLRHVVLTLTHGYNAVRGHSKAPVTLVRVDGSLLGKLIDWLYCMSTHTLLLLCASGLTAAAAARY